MTAAPASAIAQTLSSPSAVELLVNARLDGSALTIERLEPHGGYDDPLPETLERLMRRSPGRHGFAISGSRMILRNRG